MMTTAAAAAPATPTVHMMMVTTTPIMLGQDNGNVNNYNENAIDNNFSVSDNQQRKSSERAQKMSVEKN